MGRPLWKSRLEGLVFGGIVDLAAIKLLWNCSPATTSSFKDETMNGVASALCRLGIRSFSSSALASRTVSEFMAVLSCVMKSKDRFISAYASEPLLTFGAARVWYAAAGEDDHHVILHRYILPQLGKLMHQEVVDTGGIGELVARLVLLLGMDTVGAVVLGKRGRCYTGEFYTVLDFMGVLHGESPPVQDSSRNVVTTETVADMKAWRDKWSGWQVGFSHFVQLTKEPDEECLWAMLARRAAGMFPRNLKGVDLIIPIFKDTHVSMILVQVKNRANGDAAYPDSATTATRPRSVFTGDCQSWANDDVLRIYMNLRSTKEAQRFLLRDEGEKRSKRIRARAQANTKTPLPVPDIVSYVLCIQGLGVWNVKAQDNPGVFMSQEVVAALAQLLEPWWQPFKLIEADLSAGTEPAQIRVYDSQEILAEVSRSMVKDLVENKGSRILRDDSYAEPDTARADEDDRGKQGGGRPSTPTPGYAQADEVLPAQVRMRGQTGKRKAAGASAPASKKVQP